MKNVQHLIDKLNQLVQDAKTSVELYRQMYSGVSSIKSMDNFAQLPILTKSILITERLANTLADSVQVSISRTFEDSLRANDYMPKLLSYEDVLDEYKVLNFFMMPIKNNSTLEHKIMLIADSLHVYAIAELGHQLAYDEWPLATFIIRNQSMRELQSCLTWFKPTIIFLDASQNIPAEIFPDSVKYLFTFNQPNKPETGRSSDQSLKSFDILRDAWIGPVAIRVGDDCHYTFDSKFFYFEDSVDGSLLVTSFINRLQPVIRYRLPYRGLLTGTNTFVLNSCR